MQTVDLAGTPVIPSKIVCIGRNYVAHIKELGNDLPEEMVVFCKPNSSITSQLRASHQHEELHYEAEICYMARGGHLAAVSCGLDLTKRDLQGRLKAKGLPWERAKAFDGAALFGSFVALPSLETELGIELLVDGVTRQKGSTALMLFSPSRIVAELSSFMTLEDGDIIMTGTPAGVGRVIAGEMFETRLLTEERCLVNSRWLAI
jgi:2-keto-4-pentenoate hydratase/2-oxohepta-3-ene-1,7-dioic acid hydratase in catechol pathway